MTVTAQENRTSVVGSATAGQAVPFTFPITSTSDITVLTRVITTAVEATLTETTDYTVSITGDSGGTVTMVDAIAATYEIHIIRDTPMTQTLDLVQGGTFNAENVEDALDKNTKLAIDNSDAIGRTIRIADTDAAIDVISNAVDRASKYLAFDANGVPTVVSSVATGEVTIGTFAETYLNAADAESTRNTLQVISPATYTVYKSGSTYHAIASGERTTLTDLSSANFVDLLDLVMGKLGKNGTHWVEGNSLLIREGSYVLTKTWTIPPTQDFVLDAGCTLFSCTSTTTDGIVIDSSMNSRFTFGLVTCNPGTSTAACRIKPAVIGPDASATFLASYVRFSAVLNANQKGLVLDASVADIIWNIIVIEEGGSSNNPTLYIPDPLSGEVVTSNIITINAHDVVKGILVGDGGATSSSIKYNMFRGYLGGSGGTTVGLDCHGSDNTFELICEGFANGKAAILRANSSGNVIKGLYPDGYTIEGGDNVTLDTQTKGDYNGSAAQKNFVVGYRNTNTTLANDLGMVIRQCATTTDALSGLHFSGSTGSTTANQYAIAGSILVKHGARTSNQYHEGTMYFLTAPGSNVAPAERMNIAPDGTVTIAGTVKSPNYSIMVNENQVVCNSNRIVVNV